MAPRMPGDEAQGKVKGGDGARSPKPSPDQGGFHPAPGEKHPTGIEGLLIGGEGVGRPPHPGLTGPIPGDAGHGAERNSRVIGIEAGLHLGITPTKPGRGTHNRLHTGGY